MGSDARPMHVLFFPLMAPGHMLPMVDMARLFAARGVKATVLTTPANQPAVQAAIDDLALHSFPSPIHLHLRLIPFPSAVGLPAGIENLSSFPMDEQPIFMAGVRLLRDPFRSVLADLRPDAVVTDSFLPWTLIVSQELNIPRLVFHGQGFFALCVNDSMSGGRQIPSEGNTEVITVPNFPRRIELLRSQLPDPAESDPVFSEMYEEIAKWEHRSYGVVVNSFYELEAEFADHLRGALKKKAWHIGPLSLCSNRKEQRPRRGRSTTSSIEDLREHCLTWLDEKESDSVLYVSFGSMGWLTEAQFRELALGLEACGRPFIWAAKNCGEEWWPEGYTERMRGRCLILEKWAPQVSILSHAAVGGFMTHCGWNSTLEAVSAGVPMVTWPFFADQFSNEKLIVEVLGIGVSIGAKQHTFYAEKRPLVTAAEIEETARRLMDESEEATRMRLKAKELASMAKNAMEEGGSSHRDLGNLIQDLIDRRSSGCLNA